MSIGVAVALLVTLSGCTVPPNTAAKLIDGQFIFVSCEDFTFDTISVGTIDFDNWSEGYIRRWSASGLGVIAAGGQITYGDAPDGLLTIRGPMKLPLKHQRVEVYLSFEPVDQPSVEVFGIFDSRKLSSDHWLRGDGNQNDKPCD
jgi:hypothetical protein